jgi:Phosphoesterase family
MFSERKSFPWNVTPGFSSKGQWAGASAFLMDWAAPVIEKAYGAGPCPGHLNDIEHIVLLMQENRSFDHYFGTLSSTRGFSSAQPDRPVRPDRQRHDLGVQLRIAAERGPAQSEPPVAGRRAEIAAMRAQRGAGNHRLHAAEHSLADALSADDARSRIRAGPRYCERDLYLTAPAAPHA